LAGLSTPKESQDVDSQQYCVDYDQIQLTDADGPQHVQQRTQVQEIDVQWIYAQAGAEGTPYNSCTARPLQDVIQQDSPNDLRL
jgi:hypothetical protein